MELKDTVELMNSDDYVKRFRAEYYQLKIRYEKLHNMIIKYKAGTLNFTTDCPLELLVEQCNFMRKYLELLEVRAEIEEIYTGEENK